jgi:hypothetical protein
MSALTWRRDGVNWLLLSGKRRMGRVVPDLKWPGMWRSTLSGGRLSDMANLSLGQERRPCGRRARAGMGGSHADGKTPLKMRGKQGCFGASSPVRCANGRGGSRA